MKKLTSIALAIVMIASVMLLTACGGKSAYQIYTEAFEKTKALESAEFTSSLTASFEKDGEQYLLIDTAGIRRAAEHDGQHQSKNSRH